MKESLNKKLKIGMLSFYYPHLGGSGLVSTRIASHLAKEGHEIHFIGYETDKNPEEMERLGIHLHKVKKVDYPCLKNEPYVWTLASKVCEVDKEYDLDLIHANYALPHAAAAFLAREQIKARGKYLPYVVTGHGSDIHTNGSKDEVNPILELALNSSDALTYVSKDLKQIAEDSLGIKKEGVHISNFVDTTEFYSQESDLRSKLGIGENVFVIGHVSNFAPIKEVYRIANLAENLKREGVLDDFCFLMCGDGRMRSALEERVSKIGAADNFKFLGPVYGPDLVEAYNSMDTFLLTSKHEGNPLVLLEAMACQKPVIGTNVGGISEVIDKEVGFLFDEREELPEIINYLKNNPEISRKMGMKALEKVKNKYSKEEIMEEYLGVYNSLINMKKNIPQVKKKRWPNMQS